MTDGWTAGWLIGGMDGRTDEQTDDLDGHRDGPTNGRGRITEQTDMDGMNVLVERGDGRTVGWPAD